MQKPLPCPPQPSLCLRVTCDPLPYSPWPPWACHAPGALTVHLGAVCPTAGTRSVQNPSALLSLPQGHGPPAGLLEGQGKDPPWPRLFQPLSPWLTLAEGKMAVPDQFCFLGGYRAGNWDTGWWLGQGTPAASPALPLAVTSGRLLPALGLLVYPALRRVLASPS